VRKVVEPIGNSKPDWEIICAVADAMQGISVDGDQGVSPTVRQGAMFDHNSPEEIWDEIRSVWPGARGITYERLENQGIQWPCLAEDDEGTEILHTENFALGKTTALRRIPFHATKELVDDEFPFLLNTGRSLYQFNAGTMTRRTANRDLLSTDYLDISPEDAAHLKLETGESVKVRSRYGEITLPVRINSRVKPGELFATFHDASVFLNRLTSSHRDRHVKTPEYKVTAVSVTKASAQLSREATTEFSPG
jgi:formate dehydrogenase major subunit